LPIFAEVFFDEYYLFSSNEYGLAVEHSRSRLLLWQQMT